MSVGNNEEPKEMLYTPPHGYPTEPYVYIDAKDVNCPYTVFNGESIGCRISEDGFTCNDFNNPDEPCIFRQLLYYKNMVKKKEKLIHDLMLNTNYTSTLKTLGDQYDKL